MIAMIDVKRKRGESFEAMLRRFSRRVQLSGRMKEAKRIRFHSSGKNKTELKKSALRRLVLQREYEQLKKMGKLPENTFKKRR